MEAVRVAIVMPYCCRCTAAKATRCKQRLRDDVCSDVIVCLRVGDIIGQKDTARQACNKQPSILPCFMHSRKQQVHNSVKHSLP